MDECALLSKCPSYMANEIQCATYIHILEHYSKFSSFKFPAIRGYLSSSLELKYSLLPKPLSCLERWKSLNYIHLLKQLSWLSLTSLPRHLSIRTLNLFLVFFSPMLFFSVSMPIFIINLSQNSF